MNSIKKTIENHTGDDNNIDHREMNKALAALSDDAIDAMTSTMADEIKNIPWLQDTMTQKYQYVLAQWTNYDKKKYEEKYDKIVKLYESLYTWQQKDQAIVEAKNAMTQERKDPNTTRKRYEWSTYDHKKETKFNQQEMISEVTEQQQKTFLNKITKLERAMKSKMGRYMNGYFVWEPQISQDSGKYYLTWKLMRQKDGTESDQKIDLQIPLVMLDGEIVPHQSNKTIMQGDNFLSLRQWDHRLQFYSYKHNESDFDT